MIKEITPMEAGLLLSHNGFLVVGYPLKCRIPENEKTWIFQINSLWGIEQRVIVGVTEDEEYLEIQKLILPNSDNAGKFIDQFLRKNCKEYKGKFLVEMRDWKDES